MLANVRRIYFDKLTGNKLVEVGYKGKVIPSTVEEDLISFVELSERNRETFDYIELEYGQYAQDFQESSGYRVNPETKELEFSYPDPKEPEAEQPYQAPLSVEVAELKARQDSTEDALLDLLLMGGM